MCAFVHKSVRLHASFCHGNGSHFGAHSLNGLAFCTKMAAVAVAKLLLCCDIIIMQTLYRQFKGEVKGHPNQMYTHFFD